LQQRENEGNLPEIDGGQLAKPGDEQQDSGRAAELGEQGAA
jgi:hypothetical protein